MTAKKENQFANKVLDGEKGKLMLEIAKTFKGDKRFQLDQRFEKDVDIQKLPQKFKQTFENDLLQRVQKKTKQIKKQQPSLIVRRFEPGTTTAQEIIKKAQGKKKYIESVIKSEKKKMQKKNQISKGVDKVAKANSLLVKKQVKQLPKFKLEVKGDKKQAFKASSFKLFQ